MSGAVVSAPPSGSSAPIFGARLALPVDALVPEQLFEEQRGPMPLCQYRLAQEAPSGAGAVSGTPSSGYGVIASSASWAASTCACR